VPQDDGRFFDRGRNAYQGGHTCQHGWDRSDRIGRRKV
jgi:hypothetical protein